MARKSREESQPVYTDVVTNWFSEEDHARHDALKRAALEALLGPMDNMVLHAPLPFWVGGGLDLYRYRQALPGTVFATMEMIYPDGQGPRPNRYGTYELLACTRLSPGGDQYALFAEEINRSRLPYELIENRISRMLTRIGHFSRSAVLNPGDTCEIPDGPKEVMCVLLDRFDRGEPFRVGDREHHLMLCMEIFPEEMEYARRQGSAALIDRLQDAAAYPYSDLDRQPVV